MADQVLQKRRKEDRRRESRRERFLVAERTRERREHRRKEVEPTFRRQQSRSSQEKTNKDQDHLSCKLAVKLCRQGMSMVVEDVDEEEDPQEDNANGFSVTGIEGIEEVEEEIKEETSKSESGSENSPEEVLHVSDVESEHESDIEEIILPPYLPAIQGCRSVDEFHCLNRIEEGTYGVVYRARDKRTNDIVALKRLKMEREKEGFPITSLREVNTLLQAQHPNIVTVREIVVGHNMDRIYIVMDYVEHDLKSLMETMKKPFRIGEVKTLMIQLLRAVAHLHDNWILHRDLKTSNLLLSHNGILKVGDFGLARQYGSPLKQYTPVVVTLWYRAPELLLAAKKYSTPIDIWSVGCIFAELLTMKPLFQGTSEHDQLKRIFNDLGTPNEKIWPGFNELPYVDHIDEAFPHVPYHSLRSRFSKSLTKVGFELMDRFLTYNPAARITAEKALEHSYFTESPFPVASHMFPTWPAKSELNQNPTPHSPKPPSGGKQYKQLEDADEAELASVGFRLNIPPQDQVLHWWN